MYEDDRKKMQEQQQEIVVAAAAAAGQAVANHAALSNSGNSNTSFYQLIRLLNFIKDITRSI